MQAIAQFRSWTSKIFRLDQLLLSGARQRGLPGVGPACDRAAALVVTNPNPDKATFRVPQRVRIKARSAGNGDPLVKERNAESGPLWGSLRANRWAAIRGVAPAHHRAGYGSADAPGGLTAQRFAE